MKTAEEWANEVGETVMLDCFAGDRMARPGDPTINLVKQIQLDAFKAGMTEAAGMVSCKDGLAIRQAILSARDNKTTI